MEQITDSSKLSVLSKNTVISDNSTVKLINSKIIFHGINNILVIEDGVSIRNSTIAFYGDNGLCYLSKNKFDYYIDAIICNCCTLFIGKNCYFNWRGRMSLTASEFQNILIGNDGLFSFGIHILTADLHPLYDCATKHRINRSGSVFIGDHVWLGQNSLILKRTRIGSGAVIGGSSVVTGKSIPSNCSFAGNPAKQIRDGVFFTSESVNKWTLEKSQDSIQVTDQWIYEQSPDNLDISYIDSELKKCSISSDRLSLLQEQIIENKNKNRFYIAPINPSPVFKGLKIPWSRKNHMESGH